MHLAPSCPDFFIAKIFVFFSLKDIKKYFTWLMEVLSHFSGIVLPPVSTWLLVTCLHVVSSSLDFSPSEKFTHFFKNIRNIGRMLYIYG